MKTSKRLSNTMGLKVSFIPATDTKGNFYKITQTNNKKSVIISGNIDVEIIDFISNVLDRIDEVKNYSLVCDNTQSKYYLFSVDFKNKSFENILTNFKKF